MTATITELDQLADLDRVPRCQLPGCDNEATHRIVYLPCHCGYPICTVHANKFKARAEQMIRNWHCELCGQPLGFGCAAYFTRIEAL